VLPCLKSLRCDTRLGDPQIRVRYSIESTLEFVRPPLDWHLEAYDLAPGVDACIGSAGSLRHHAASHYSFEPVLEYPLDRAFLGLALPAGKIVAGILKDRVTRLVWHVR
jgi:hypothetical protein